LEKIVLVAINAKFIHANAAIYSLMAYCRPIPITPLEFTANDNFNFILSEIHAAAPDVLGFSCYIWNMHLVEPLVRAIKKILPQVKIILGGPEVSFDAADLLTHCPADIIVTGEGEEVLREILSGHALSQIKGVTYRAETGEVRANPPHRKLDLAVFPFPYNADNLPENKIIYYESARGCPFSCAFCLSHNEKPVRFVPLARVFADMDFFLTRRVAQVKFTDRTFNCDPDRALRIWRYINDNDNGHTNFHFEVAATLLDAAALELLGNAPDALFQFEIGIQSTHPQTLESINRDIHTRQAIDNINKLASRGNIHIHLDLIAGLPGEGYERFQESFNAVYCLAPDMLQLGFLKLLKGSRLREKAGDFGILYNDAPPYEVLCTRDISYDGLKSLKAIEQAVDTLYNSGNFKQSLKYVQGFFATPFALYEAFSRHWKSRGYHRASQSLPSVFKIFHAFAQPHGDANVLANLLKFDWYAAGNTKNLPWLDAPTREDADKINSLYKESNTSRRLPIVKFDFDPTAEPEAIPRETEPTYILFRYTGKPRPGSQKKYGEICFLPDPVIR